MFGINDKERALYERLLQEKERVIVALSDQVDWHRAQSGTFVPNHLTEVPTPVTEEAAAFQQLLSSLQLDDPDAMHVSEDVEELLWQAEHGGDPDAIRAALESINGSRVLPFDAE